MQKPVMALIDVDGTLVDSVPDLAFCVDEMQKQLGLPQRGEQAVRQWVGNGVERLVQRALINALDGMPEASLYQKALPIFRELYAENTSVRSQIYKGIAEGIDCLKQSGIRLGCVTNKASQFTLPLLQDLGLAAHFEVIICGDQVERKKPDPQALLLAAEKMQVEAQQCIMIGDSKSDVAAARAAGFGIICMSYGYNHGEDIRDYQPDAVLDSLEEICQLLH